MPTPQPISAPAGAVQYHLEFTLTDGITPAAAVAATSALWSSNITGWANAAAGESVQAAGGATNVVVGFGPDLWRAVAIDDVPTEFVSAYAIPAPDDRGVPATQRDLWVWLSASTHDTVVTAAMRVVHALSGVAEVASEQLCAVHQDNRTWEGFIDGTENPGPFRVPAVAIIGPDLPGAGGSTVLIQRWVNDRQADFNALSLAEQEDVFGRSKRDSIEMSELPATSHVARNALKDDGVSLEIYRRNVPFGTVSEHGYIFVGFAADQSRVLRMLERMYGADASSNETPVIDALTRFTRPVSNSAYFVPSFESLARVGAAPA